MALMSSVIRNFACERKKDHNEDQLTLVLIDAYVFTSLNSFKDDFIAWNSSVASISILANGGLW